MTNTAKIPRGLIALGVCLPLAVLLGYVLAQPLESGTLAVFILIFSVLATPLLMKWYHPLLIMGWNACVTPFFLPGQFSIWVLLAFIGCFFAMLNRSVNPDRKFIFVPQVTIPLLFILAVVGVTAVLNGGFGIQSLGGSSYGGSRYVYIVAAAAGYFALTSRRIPKQRAGVYIAMFFLSGITALAGNLAYLLGPSFYFLFNLFPASVALEQAIGDYSLGPTIVRIGGLWGAVAALSNYLLARYGLRGVLGFSKPYRSVLFLLTAAGCVATGFRSALVLFAMVFAMVFYLEGLHRTKWLAVIAGVMVLSAVIVLPNVTKLPLAVQRTLSFLPVKVDMLVDTATQDSSQWRFEMWRQLLPEIPKYLLKGKGYSIDPEDLYGDAANNPLDPYTAVKAAGDYHNGPLSILIPLGIFGMIAFVWFLGGCLWTLHRYYRSGDPELKNFNTFLLALFWAKVVMFFVIFGSFYAQLFEFTGLVGLAISLNGPPANNPAAEKSVPGLTEIPHRWREREAC